MSTIIKHPENLTGEAIGVLFVDGTASVSSLDPDVRAALADHGYQFEDVKDVVTIPEGDPEQSWKNDQLKAYAEREGIELGDATNKDGYLAAIAKHGAQKAAELVTKTVTDAIK